MTTWKKCIDGYHTALSILIEYEKDGLKSAKPETSLQNMGLHILEKFRINIENCIFFYPQTEKSELNFLSLGLILRGMVSDIINYRYLVKINEIAGPDAVQDETNILDLSFIKEYKAMVRSEIEMAKGDDEVNKRIEQSGTS
ncbi:hypothetical protein [Parachryseolinea silvisoli]|uniref:hypothetical protein n=1 Tax=Parachryseolinea silvisoli TaxID=2873601 RepID=UPI002265B655|nr:hypothetical protein [Parachryseolinea silvisoli]MCD9015201.1 hypothetical protein [Parachryseolinea silvisoli]